MMVPISTMILAALISLGMIPGSVSREVIIHIEERSRLFIEGTSNINSFECLCNDRFNPKNVRVSVDDDRETISFFGTTLALKTAALDCDNSKINKDLCTALKADEYPTIDIVLHEASVHGASFNERDWTDIKATATLTITDQSRKVSLAVKGRKLSGNRFRFVSIKKLKMTDFGVEPPTALFGLVRVRNHITINFNLIVTVD